MKNNIYVFENGSNILTSGNLITEGNRYTYKEGSRIGKIIVEEVIPDPEFLRLKINFYEVGRIIEVSHRKDFTGGYMGMWRIYDEFIMSDMDVEFNEDDYEISFEDEDEDNPGGVNLELNRSYYNLDKIYTILILSE